DKLQPGDIIRIYHFLDTAKEVPELRYVRVLSVTDSGGVNVDNAKELAEDEEKQQSATITVLASTEQARIITELENDGVAHVALVSRGNDALAEELLAQQAQTLLEIYYPDTLAETEPTDDGNRETGGEPAEISPEENSTETDGGSADAGSDAAWH
ncbi:MAG: pilus assembly protein CpaB, partial [Blautia sp.]|nr:pilus assembly protein CpaB [Blautia sp.]